MTQAPSDPPPPPRTPLFLERDSYRSRRVQDAARLLPFFAAALWLVPMFWTANQSTAGGLIYLFGVWLLVICLSAVLSRRLLAPIRDREETPGADQTPGRDAP